jgi:hypothetical protein
MSISRSAASHVVISRDENGSRAWSSPLVICVRQTLILLDAFGVIVAFLRRNQTAPWLNHVHPHSPDLAIFHVKVGVCKE